MKKKRKTFEDQMLEYEGNLLLGKAFDTEEEFLVAMLRRFKIMEQVTLEAARLLREATNGADVDALLADLHEKYRLYALETGEVEG